jgi:hypothetical protein
MSKLKLPGTCIFCGRPGVTKQHLWPDRLKKIISAPDTHTKLVVRDDTTLPDRSIVPGEPTHGPYRPGTALTRQIRKVCRRCNGGWIRDLEEAAIPIATPMMLGDPTILTRADQAIIARWIAVVVAVSEYLHTESVAIPAESRKALEKTNLLSEQWTICLAPYGGLRWGTHLRRHSMTLLREFVPRGSTLPPLNIQRPALKDTQITTIGMKKLLAQGLTTSIPEVAASYRSQIPQLGARQIHPYIGDIQWPATSPLDDSGAETFADWLDNSLGSKQARPGELP